MRVVPLTNRGRSASGAPDRSARPARGIRGSASLRLRLVRSALQLELTAATGKRFAGYLSEHLRRAHALLQPPLRELSLALVGDARMSKLHEHFMGISGPTDVLTFPLDHDARGRVVSGEVVVCVPEALRRSKESGEKPQRELLLYALHGMLHLCGYDDRTDRGFRRMHHAEDMILTRLGVGPVFAPSRRKEARR